MAQYSTIDVDVEAAKHIEKMTENTVKMLPELLASCACSHLWTIYMAKFHHAE